MLNDSFKILFNFSSINCIDNLKSSILTEVLLTNANNLFNSEIKKMAESMVSYNLFNNICKIFS